MSCQNILKTDPREDTRVKLRDDSDVMIVKQTLSHFGHRCEHHFSVNGWRRKTSDSNLLLKWHENEQLPLQRSNGNFLFLNYIFY